MMTKVRRSQGRHLRDGHLFVILGHADGAGRGRYAAGCVGAHDLQTLIVGKDPASLYLTVVLAWRAPLLSW